MNTIQEQIELLTTDLLRDKLFGKLLSLKNRYNLSLGWHYPIDIIWTVRQIEKSGLPKDSTIVDVGAGNGVLQFMLARLGYRIISVDYSERILSRKIRMAFNVNEMETKNQFSSSYLDHLKKAAAQEPSKVTNKSIFSKLYGYSNIPFYLFHRLSLKGSISYYKSDMRAMNEIKDMSVDAIVSISAIEHLEKEQIKEAYQEMKRVTKRNGILFVTTSASKETDWFHEPSKGWCFSKKTLSELFEIPIQEPTYSNYDVCLAEYQHCELLKRILPESYKLSKYNGMPLGVWDPQYVPVGISKSFQ